MINPKGPDLLVDPREDLGYMEYMTPPEREKVNTLIQELRSCEVIAWVSREHWLNLTENYEYRTKELWRPAHSFSGSEIPARFQLFKEEEYLAVVAGMEGLNGYNAKREALVKFHGTTKPRRKKGESRYYAPNSKKGASLSDLILKLNRQLFLYGPPAGTALNRNAGIRSWVDYCAVTERPIFRGEQESQGSFEEALMFFVSTDTWLWGNKVETITARVNAIKVLHLSSGYADPTLDLRIFPHWKNLLRKVEKGRKPKIPYPALLLWALVEGLPKDSLDSLGMRAALCLGFNFMLRASMYLRTKLYPGNLQWKHVQFSEEENQNGTYSTHLTGQAVTRATWLRLSLFSTKTRVEATRSLPKTGSGTCPVSALADLYMWHLTQTGLPPNPDTPVFQQSSTKVLSVGDLNTMLKFGAQEVGIPTSEVASHSLRRGGVTAYLAANADRRTIQIFGFWRSEECFLLYEWIDRNILEDSAFKAQSEMPHLERTLCY